MFKLGLSKQELDDIKSKIYLSDIQERILEYRMKEYSITKMAQLENCSEATISREIRKIKDKLTKVI